METPEPMVVYPLRAWLDDYRWFCHKTREHGSHSASMGRADFEAHFSETRKDPAVAEHCLERFVRGVSFLEQNIHALEFGKVAVAGADEFMKKTPGRVISPRKV